MVFKNIHVLCNCLEGWFLVSVEEWKKELAGYLIDYHSLDIKNTIASGLLIVSNYSMHHFAL